MYSIQHYAIKFSPRTPVSSINKTDRHGIIPILLEVAFKHHNLLFLYHYNFRRLIFIVCRKFRQFFQTQIWWLNDLMVEQMLTAINSGLLKSRTRDGIKKPLYLRCGSGLESTSMVLRLWTEDNDFTIQSTVPFISSWVIKHTILSRNTAMSALKQRPGVFNVLTMLKRWIEAVLVPMGILHSLHKK